MAQKSSNPESWCLKFIVMLPNVNVTFHNAKKDSKNVKKLVRVKCETGCSFAITETVIL